MDELVLIGHFLLAILLGALIGLEREYARYRKHSHDYAGIRTFPLISLFGALSAFLGEILNQWILVAGITLMGALIVVSYFVFSSSSRKYHGATSEVAGFLAFFIGILSYYGEIRLAVVLTVVITILLYSRSVLHHFAEHLKKQELRDTLKFALIAFVILPFLPNKDYGPLGLFNPFMMWLFVVFISGISFAGYILVKIFSKRGIEFTSILGGLASSTIVTSTFANRSKKQPNSYKLLALGVILANGVMFFRILLETLAVNEDLFVAILLPILILAAATVLLSYFLWKKTDSVREELQLKSPFSLGPALKIAFLFTAISAFVKLAQAYLPLQGVYAVSLISGLAQADAITISLSQLGGSSIPLEIARNGIMIAASANILLKGAIVFFFGERKFSGLVIGAFALLLLLSALMLFLL